MIEPTPGRVVWYRPGEKDPLRSPQEHRPLAAHIAWVNSPTSVNLMVIDRSGRPHGRVYVTLVQDGGDHTEGESYCQWMPYQVGQAAKTDDLAPRVKRLEGAMASELELFDMNKAAAATDA